MENEWIILVGEENHQSTMAVLYDLDNYMIVYES